MVALGMTLGATSLSLCDRPLAFRLCFLATQLPWMAFYAFIGSIPGIIESSGTAVSIMVALWRFHAHKPIAD